MVRAGDAGMSHAGRQLARVVVMVCALGLLLAGASAAMAAPGELDLLIRPR